MSSSNFLTLSCIILAVLTLIALNVWILRMKEKPPFRKIVLLTLIPCVFFLPIVYQIYADDMNRKSSEIAGRIIKVDQDRTTSVQVGAEQIILNLTTNDIDVDDSFYKPKGQRNEYHFFKKDSSGQFHEIEFYPPDSNNVARGWKFMDK